VPQEVALLPGTVRDNVSRFESQEDEPAQDIDSAVIAACQAAGIHEDILRLPQGYGTPIEAGGVQLSGGQRQRLALARALYREPSVLILDEPNSNLDHAGEMALQNVLQRLRQTGRTVIVVTHRPNLLSGCHKVLSLVGGQVQLFGPRDEVMAKIVAASRPQVAPLPASGTGNA
jgi:ABC-type protease/lipase transport system fused ATPase/permease subunit